MGVNYNGYNYPIATGSIIPTDSLPTAPKPGVAVYVGENTPDSAQVGDIWISSTGIRRYTPPWNLYVGASGAAGSIFKAGSQTFSGSAATISFSSTFSATPSVVVSVNSSTGTFNEPPGYSAGVFNNNYVIPLVYNVTTTGFTVQICSAESGTAVSGNWTVQWIATLPTTGAPGNSSTTAGSFTGTTDSNGLVTVPFNYTYTSIPSVVATPRDTSPNVASGVYETKYAIKNVTTTGFQLAVTQGDSSTPIGSGKTVKFNWIANSQTYSSPSGLTSAGISTQTATGIYNISYGYTYQSVPAVVAYWTNGTLGVDPDFTITNVTTTGFQVVLSENDGATSTTSRAATWSWIATPYV